MDKTIVIRLNGHDERFELDQEAYDQLRRYLDRAASRLRDDPDQEEVLGDLERSLGDKLAAMIGTDDRVVSAADMDGVLEEIGAVDTGRDPVADDTGAPRRRLQRIREGQQIAGVCNGIAAYGEFNVGWVRTLFLAAAVLTGGLFILVYIALALIMPIKPAARRA